MSQEKTEAGSLSRLMKKITLRLYARDVNVLKEFYPEVGYNHVVRALVHRHTRQLEAAVAKKLSTSEFMVNVGELKEDQSSGE